MVHILTLIATGSMVVALCFQLIGVCAVGWERIERIEYESGLWKYCIGLRTADVCNNFGENAPDWLKAVQAFAVLGVVTICVCLVCALLVVFKRGNPIFNLITKISAGVAGLFVVIEFAVYAGKGNVQAVTLEYCFGLTVAASVLCGLSALLFHLGIDRSGYVAISG